MYGSYSALDRDINYLIHYNTKGSHWYHIGDGKRQENPKKYAKGEATIGFDPSKYEQSKLWTKLKGKQNDLKSKAESERKKAAQAKENSDIASKDAKSKKSEAKKLAKEYDGLMGGFKKFFDKNYESETPKKIEDLVNKSNESSKYSKTMNKWSKGYSRKASRYDVASKLMNIPIKAVEFGIRTKDKISSVAKTIGSIRIGKETLGNRAKQFTNFILSKISPSYKKKLANQQKIVSDSIALRNAQKVVADDIARRNEYKNK